MGDIGICGFGRLGRTFLRVALVKKLFAPSDIGDIKDPAAMSALLKVETNCGRWTKSLTASPRASRRQPISSTRRRRVGCKSTACGWDNTCSYQFRAKLVGAA